MIILFAEQFAVLLGTLLLASPLLIGVAFVVWTHRLAERGRIAYAPVLLAAATAVAGVAVTSSASSGLEGIGAVLLGMYLIGAGGLTALVCGLVTYGRARSSSSASSVAKRSSGALGS